jgi:glycosyltransferase involved in cell wall biosynthesis
MNIINAMFSTVNGGVEQVFLDYNQALSDLGYNTIALMHPWSPIKRQCKHASVKTLYSYGSNDHIAVFRLKRLIQTHAIDAIITHTRRTALLVHQTKTPITKIAVCHDPQLFPLLNTTSDAIITVTEAMREHVVRRYLPQKPVISVPNMIHIPKTLAFESPVQAKVPVIGAMSRMCHEKGLHVLIDALGKLKEKNIVFKAKIAGDGKFKKHYLQQIAQLNLQDEVSLIGWVDDKESFYRSLNIFCLPSLVESFGLVVLESMMYSIPMVLSKVSGPCEIVGASECALLANPNDSQDLAKHLLELIEHHHKAQELAQRAFLRVQDFSAQNVALKLQDAMKRICR